MQPLILYLVTEDWAFCSHRLPTALGAEDVGLSVGVMAREDRHGGAVRSLGYAFYPLPWVRRSLNPFLALRDLWQIVAHYRRLRPAIVHHVALKPVLLGGLAARLVKIPAQIAAINGVGFIFTDEGLQARLLRCFLVPLLRFVMRRRHVSVWFQNEDDRDLFIRLGIIEATQAVILPGSGVDTEILQVLPEPPEPIICAYAGRMLRSKGIDLLVEAVGECREQGLDLRLLLAGSTDDNPTSFSQAQLTAWARLPGVEYLGHVNHIAELWARAHIAVLPCRVREGLPKALLDAAACGRPIVASDVEGVRAIAHHDENAILVPPGDFTALVSALRNLAKDKSLRQRLGASGRAMVEGAMSAKAIRARASEIYKTIISVTGDNS